MRNLVEPLPSTHCEHCNGELLFKRERDDRHGALLDADMTLNRRPPRPATRAETHGRRLYLTCGALPE
jgi:hypothetical protein